MLNNKSPLRKELLAFYLAQYSGKNEFPYHIPFASIPDGGMECVTPRWKGMHETHSVCARYNQLIFEQFVLFKCLLNALNIFPLVFLINTRALCELYAFTTGTDNFLLIEQRGQYFVLCTQYSSHIPSSKTHTANILIGKFMKLWKKKRTISIFEHLSWMDHFSMHKFVYQTDQYDSLERNYDKIKANKKQHTHKINDMK